MSQLQDQEILDKINNKTKPLGALGKLEKLAFQIARVQQSLTPALTNPHLVVFAASHGIADEGVSAYPSAVTHQMVLNFLAGGAAINVFTRQHGIRLMLVDAGVDYDFEQNDNLINAKIGAGTGNFLHEAAMTEAQLEACLKNGADIVKNIAETACNVVGFGEMGIGNTSSAAVIMSILLDIELADCVGKGTGIDHEQYNHKVTILRQAIANHPVDSAPFDVLRQFGGFEIAMMCGAMLQAAKEKMLILVDGFISSTAFLCAVKMEPFVREFGVFCHQSEEKGHQKLLSELNAEPLLSLDMRLGEGTGCAIAYPLLQSAVAFFNEMASFESAGVSNKTA
jgi:nicotinate-nucleotide--dimethylbenzimidazole phosphoribosyltransferase